MLPPVPRPARLVTVVGSLNVDFVVDVHELPRPGATVVGLGTSIVGPGGKGANQAAAAATFAGSAGAVALVGCVGADDEAEVALRDLRDRGVDLAGVRRLDDAPTGRAHIALDAAGQNLIVVDPGANARLTAEDVRCDDVRDAAVTLLQLEVPVAAAVAAARHAEGLVILNPAPALATDLSELLGEVDVLVPNRGELAQLLGEPPARSLDRAAAQARALPCDGAVVVTLGDEGALVVTDDAVQHVAAPSVTALDTTGAGDCFCGTLAVALAEGDDLVSAVGTAVRAASVSVTGRGARGRLPGRADLA
jgi:ribokinase